MSIKHVVKIGGSLFPEYAVELAKQLENTDSLIILGGGEFANLIRRYDSEMKFSDEANHWTAIDCMEIIAKLVNDKVDSSRLAYTIDEARKISDEGFTPIFVVSGFLKAEDPFECSWDVTSDSIAAYVANLLNANLFIVTDVNGIYTQEPKEPGSTFISKIDATTLLTFQESSIDAMLPTLLLRYGSDCYVVNGKFPERVRSLIDDNINDYNFDYTQIIGE
ncbi:MAG: delta 1-pyrroline-5-carboxylate synthetase [Methanobrevibacter thaueri]|uniref:Delta 1-pyrroline-5-carboxylate synthetase n=1 Tax=Methanobrevibacter thaueri TaxID=190975 RepID=A0A8T3V4F7_9EURY|nr:delta 1-pyrroline-5-carboxylate synthetase [Methanobrevibacter thaueri]MBE6501181.1 delta 1-pyrroline-5-carboxylate synthetase [Methanobrevibacter thaueri]